MMCQGPILINTKTFFLNKLISYKVMVKLYGLKGKNKFTYDKQNVNMASDSLEKHSVMENSGARLKRFSRNKNENQESKMELNLSLTIKTP